MKIVFVFFIFCGFIFCLASCTKSCSCGRQCNIFNNGAIRICQTSYADSAQFARSTDSLKNLYGNYTSAFADSVAVSGSSSNAINTISGQLQQQGYTCNCIY